MPCRLRLLPDRKMCLMIPMSELLRIGRLVRPSVVLRALLLLEVEIVRLRSPHIQKEFSKLQIFLLTGQLIQFCERHLRDLMSGIAFTLSVLRPELFSNKVRESLRRLQQLILAGRLIIGCRSLEQMSETVELVVISEVGENAVHTVDDIVGVQIAVLRLCRTDNIDRLIRSPLKLRIGMVNQGIADRLNPLREVAVLKNKAVEFIRVGVLRILRQCLKAAEGIGRLHKASTFLFFTVHHLPCNLKVPHTITRRGIRHSVVERLPLIGDHLAPHEFLLPAPEFICDLHLF